jgi:aminoglycoside 6'-N-acetyltransferase I
VRLIGPGDVETWCRMRAGLWPDAPEGEPMREAEAHLRGEGLLAAVFLCQTASGHTLGMIELSLRSFADGCRSMPVPYVEGWYVVPEARHRGIGRALVVAAERWARNLGHTGWPPTRCSGTRRASGRTWPSASRRSNGRYAFERT